MSLQDMVEPKLSDPGMSLGQEPPQHGAQSQSLQQGAPCVHNLGQLVQQPLGDIHLPFTQIGNSMAHCSWPVAAPEGNGMLQMHDHYRFAMQQQLMQQQQQQDDTIGRLSKSSHSNQCSTADMCLPAIRGCANFGVAAPDLSNKAEQAPSSNVASLQQNITVTVEGNNQPSQPHAKPGFASNCNSNQSTNDDLAAKEGDSDMPASKKGRRNSYDAGGEAGSGDLPSKGQSGLGSANVDLSSGNEHGAGDSDNEKRPASSGEQAGPAVGQGLTGCVDSGITGTPRHLTDLPSGTAVPSPRHNSHLSRSGHQAQHRAQRQASADPHADGGRSQQQPSKHLQQEKHQVASGPGAELPQQHDQQQQQQVHDTMQRAHSMVAGAAPATLACQPAGFPTALPQTAAGGTSPTVPVTPVARGFAVQDDPHGDHPEEGPCAGEGAEDCRSNGNSQAHAHATKRQRLVWTSQLHHRFMNAVHQLGVNNAVPKNIMALMNVEGMSRENVASHLQKYRLYLKRLAGITGNDPIPNSVLLQVQDQAVRQHAVKQLTAQQHHGPAMPTQQAMPMQQPMQQPMQAQPMQAQPMAMQAQGPLPNMGGVPAAYDIRGFNYMMSGGPSPNSMSALPGNGLPALPGNSIAAGPGSGTFPSSVSNPTGRQSGSGGGPSSASLGQGSEGMSMGGGNPMGSLAMGPGSMGMGTATNPMLQPGGQGGVLQQGSQGNMLLQGGQNPMLQQGSQNAMLQQQQQAQNPMLQQAMLMQQLAQMNSQQQMMNQQQQMMNMGQGGAPQKNQMMQSALAQMQGMAGMGMAGNSSGVMPMQQQYLMMQQQLPGSFSAAGFGPQQQQLPGGMGFNGFNFGAAQQQQQQQQQLQAMFQQQQDAMMQCQAGNAGEAASNSKEQQQEQQDAMVQQQQQQDAMMQQQEAFRQQQEQQHMQALQMQAFMQQQQQQQQQQFAQMQQQQQQHGMQMQQMYAQQMMMNQQQQQQQQISS